MENGLLNFINQGWVGAIIGIMGIIIAILTYKFSIKKPIPSYQRHSLEIIRKNQLELSKDIKISYKDVLVENLTKIEIVFWNEGRDTLKNENIVVDDPLLFKFSNDTIILSAKIIKQTRDINKSYIRISETNSNIAYFGFDYLDQNDGMIFEIIHTDINIYPEIMGTIKGIPEGIQNFGQVDLFNSKNCKNKIICLLNSRLLSLLMSFIGVFLILIGFYPSILETVQSYSILNSSDTYIRVFFIFIGVFYFALSVLLFLQKRKRFPKKLILKDID